MEAPIVFGLKRPASEGLVAGAGTGQRSDEGGTAARVVALSVAAVAWARRSSGWLASWAAARTISPNSLSGISLLLALCAAAWFSGGAHDGGIGMIAMAGWLLVLVAARGLAAYMGRQPAGASAPAARAAMARATVGAGTASGFEWLSAVCAAAAECAIYGGMAAGSHPTILIGIWPLAVTTVISIAISELLGACWRAALGAGDPGESDRTAAARRWTGRILGLPPELRALVALLAFAVAGAPAALFAVLALEVVSVVTTITMLGKIAPARGRAGRPGTGSAVRTEPALVRPATARSTAAGSKRAVASTTAGTPASSAEAPATRVTSIAGVAGSPGATGAVRIIEAGTRRAAGEGEAPAASSIAGATSIAGASRAAGPSRTAEAGGRAEAARQARATCADVAPDAAVQPGAGQATAQDVILALRDDGAAARWAGRVVQGNLIPLPPAVAGLIATAMLAALGLRNLPGFIALTPPVVMMLAAPGSSHRHDGRFDWLIPVLLALAQYVYLATLGFALAVPRPVVFSACALVLVWYASVIASARREGAGPAGPGTGQAAAGPGPGRARPAQGAFFGWETRMFAIGLAATLGLATFGYLGLAAYVGVLICRRVMTG
jgi:hypothetical protein